LATQLAPFAQESARPTEIRLSNPPSIRWINSAPPGSQSLALTAGAGATSLRLGPSFAPESSTDAPFQHSCVTESLLRNPRFPSDGASPWAKRLRSWRANLAAHPNVGAAWLFAVASVGAGIACALLAAWMQ
jgi:hypothetical protein